MAKVIFLHLSVIHSVHSGGRGSASVQAGIPPPPPRSDTTTPRSDTTTPWIRHHPPTRQADPPRPGRQGYIFTPVCHSFCSQGGRGSASVHAGIPLPRIRFHPPWIRHHPTPNQVGRPPPTRQTPPPRAGKQTPAYGLRAAGTHPTGMHSCYL